jgi:hypothetical protein
MALNRPRRARTVSSLGPMARQRTLTSTSPKGKIHRVDPDFGSTLTVSNRDSQSNCWVNWKIMGQPCEFQVLAAGGGVTFTPPVIVDHSQAKPAFYTCEWLMFVLRGGSRMIKDGAQGRRRCTGAQENDRTARG